LLRARAPASVTHVFGLIVTDVSGLDPRSSVGRSRYPAVHAELGPPDRTEGTSTKPQPLRDGLRRAVHVFPLLLALALRRALRELSLPVRSARRGRIARGRV